MNMKYSDNQGSYSDHNINNISNKSNFKYRSGSNDNNDYYNDDSDDD